jgi:hypothetical protein
MNASELNRKLLYCGLSDLTDYLRNSPLNRYLYKVLLQELPHRKVDIPVVTVFNEMYYQCVRVRYDGNPGQDVFKRYLDEEARWLNSKQASELVFEIVWVLFQLRSNLSFHEECFLEQLTPIIEKNEYSGFSRQLLSDMKDEAMWLPEEFPVMPCPVEEIPLRHDADMPSVSRFKQAFMNILMDDENFIEMRANPWRLVTNGFAHSSIEEIIKLYSNMDDQLAILNRIKLAIPFKELPKYDEFLDHLQQQIKSGIYSYSYIEANKLLFSPDGFDVDVEAERSFAAGIRQSEEEEEEQEKQSLLAKEVESLKKQLEEQRNSYEKKIEALESNYQRELESLVKELNENYQDRENDKNVEEPPQEQTLSLIKMIAHVKEQFSKSAAEEFVNMFYHISMSQGSIDETIATLIDGIVPSIIKRDSPHTQIKLSNPQQVNINPQRVINRGTGKDEEECAK